MSGIADILAKSSPASVAASTSDTPSAGKRKLSPKKTKKVDAPSTASLDNKGSPAKRRQNKARSSGESDVDRVAVSKRQQKQSAVTSVSDDLAELISDSEAESEEQDSM
jgi:hypothetical protein